MTTPLTTKTVRKELNSVQFWLYVITDWLFVLALFAALGGCIVAGVSAVIGLNLDVKWVQLAVAIGGVLIICATMQIALYNQVVE